MPGADADLSGDVDEAGRAAGRPQFAERGQIGLVVDGHRQVQLAAQQRRGVHVLPAQVGRHPHDAVRGDQAGHGQRGPGQRQVVGQGDRLPGQPGDRRQGGGRVAEALVGVLDEPVAHGAAEVHHAGGQVVHVDLQAEPGRTVRSERQTGGRPARAGSRRRFQLGQQPARDEVVDQRGDGGAGEAGGGRGGGPGDRLRAVRHLAQHQGEIVGPHAGLPHRRRRRKPGCGPSRP